MTRELLPADLCRRCDPDTIPFATVADDTSPLPPLGQDRAIEAARFAFAMRHDGYNLFALGPPGLGKRTAIEALLAAEAASQPTPDDWCHVHDFRAARRPRALRMPPGAATRLRAAMERAVEELKVAMPAAFESEEYRTRKLRLARELGQRQETAFEALQERARRLRVVVERTDTGVVVAPLAAGEPLDAEGFGHLPEEEQSALRAALEAVGAALTAMFHQFHEWQRDHLRAVHTLDRELAAAVAHRVIDAVRADHRELRAVLDYLADVEADVAEHADDFLPRPADQVPEPLRRALHGDDRLRRYRVNVMVDHGATRGAPIVHEDNPTLTNLVGSVEQVAELGALVTELTLIRAGALHRASGGYLLLDAARLLQQPMAWQALKRALRTRQIRIESAGQALGVAPVASLEPEPIPLDVKVVLFGERLLYYLLADEDPELGELFKVMADFEDDLARGPADEARFAVHLAGLVQRHGLRPFERAALARVVDHAARLAGDGDKLSLHLRPLTDLLRQAEHAARAAGRAQVTAADVEHAIDGERRRASRLHERHLEAIGRRRIAIETRGQQVGQINGLSVIELGGHAFGHPTRITARVRMGDGKVVDLEREVELGGPLHSKGVLILSGLLAGRYVPRVPLALAATLVFEQSYGPVEGDSASLAELCVLLSALAEVPITQALAVTGSLDQHGRLQPIGGVNEKIEGFFEVCQARGLAEGQGVIIPAANVSHLMLRADVVAAVADGRFHVHAASDVDEAVELLTGLPAGVREPDGGFPDGTVNALVEARLLRFAEDARRFASGSDRAAVRHFRRAP